MKTDSQYNKREFQGVKIDIYRVLERFGINHPAQQHAIKKLLRAGNGAKSLDQDIAEVVETLERWQEMRKEDATQNGERSALPGTSGRAETSSHHRPSNSNVIRQPGPGGFTTVTDNH